MPEDGVLKLTPGFGDLSEKHRPPSEAQTARKQSGDATHALCGQRGIPPRILTHEPRRSTLDVAARNGPT